MIRIAHGRVVVSDGVIDADVVIGDDGRIVRLERRDLGLYNIMNQGESLADGAMSPEMKAKGDDSGRPETVIDAAGAFVLPGFIELHTHGAGRFEFTTGLFDDADGSFAADEATYVRELPRYLALRATTGATSGFLATWAAPRTQQRFCMQQLRRYIDSGRNGVDGMFVLGGELEGTFISRHAAGAMNPAHVEPQEIGVFDDIDVGLGVVKVVNVAPDGGESAMRLTKQLSDRGIVVGAGHTVATGDQVRSAIEAGLRYAVHFLNGQQAGSYKDFDGGGAMEAILASDLFVELIGDGVHVSPRYVRDIIERKGMDRVMLVSDAMFTSQADGLTEFVANGLPGRVDPSGRFVYVPGRSKLTLFSSVATMDRCFVNLLNWVTSAGPGVWHRHHAAMSFEAAIVAASGCCSSHIAAMLASGGIDIETGILAAGKWADVVVAQIDGGSGRHTMTIRDVLVRGRRIGPTASA